jgi:hypothetical protein
MALTMGGGESDHGVRVYNGVVENNTAVATEEPSMPPLTEDGYLLSSPLRMASDPA